MIEEHAPGADMLLTRAHYLVDPVDCTAAMGKGLALVFAKRYPNDCAWFREHARAGNVKPGRAYLSQAGSKLVIFVTTKLHWRDVSSLNDVRAGLLSLEDLLVSIDADSVALPALGCGLGRLPWRDVRPLIMATAEWLVARGIRVEVYPPHEGR